MLSKSVKHLEFEEGFTSITGISGENVESVVIPEGVFAIGSFGYNIKSIHLPDSLEIIEKMHLITVENYRMLIFR